MGLELIGSDVVGPGDALGTADSRSDGANVVVGSSLGGNVGRALL